MAAKKQTKNILVSFLVFLLAFLSVFLQQCVNAQGVPVVEDVCSAVGTHSTLFDPVDVTGGGKMNSQSGVIVSDWAFLFFFSFIYFYV